MKKAVSSVALLTALVIPVVAAELPAALVQPYLKAQVLLSTDKMDGLTDVAKSIETSAAALGKDGEAMAASAKKMGVAKTFGEARIAFGTLSEALEKYVENTKATLPAYLHVAYCPMEDKPWIQKGTEIKNPYYGNQMLSCGSIKK